MESSAEKTLTTQRGYIYRYHITPVSSTKPPLLLLHGFPDTATLWSTLTPHLSSLPKSLLIPNLLGYGGTSQPTDPAAYAYHLMARDLLDILDAEHIPKVIVVGHDHGSPLAARLYNHHPERVAGVVLLNVAYRAPDRTTAFDLDAINAAGQAAFGYPPFDYWRFLTAPDAPAILAANADRLWEVANCATFAERRDWFCSADALRRYLTDRSVPRVGLKAYAEDGALRDAWVAQKRRDGFGAALCWYSALTQGIQSESDRLVLEENVKVKVPMLFIGCDQDAACRPELIEGVRKAGLVPDLTIEVCKDVAHRPMSEIPEKTARLIVDFVKSKGL